MGMQIVNSKIWILYLFFVSGMATMGCHAKQQKDNRQNQLDTPLYRCPMHHEIVRDKPGNCPICGMDLVVFGEEKDIASDVDLHTLLKPTNNSVISEMAVTSIQKSEDRIEIKALGTIQYDTREMGAIAVRVSGRIEKLYLKSTFQDVHKGQKIMDIYSPELVTGQQDLLFLIKNDPANSPFINAAMEKLLLLGMSSDQLQQVIKSQKPALTISVYSNYSGHIHDALNSNMNASMTTQPNAISNADQGLTRELLLKEGMYVQKGQTVLSIMNPTRLWIVLNIYPEDQSLVKVGNHVEIVPEAAPDKKFSAKIDFVEPFFREGSKTLTARVYFENQHMNMLPVGSQVKATIIANAINASWLPKDAVISLGLDKIVFKRQSGGFRAWKVKTGISYDNKIQIIKGLTPSDTVAAEAQYLMDSESFIKVNQ